MSEDEKVICSCRKTNCARHGKCNECIEYHRKKDQLPRCKRGRVNLFGFFNGKNK